MKNQHTATLAGYEIPRLGMGTMALAIEGRPSNRDQAIEIQFLSTLSLRRATALYSVNRCTTRISIHALLAESDCCTVHTNHNVRRISIHALLAESDQCAIIPAL